MSICKADVSSSGVISVVIRIGRNVARRWTTAAIPVRPSGPAEKELLVIPITTKPVANGFSNDEGIGGILHSCNASLSSTIQSNGFAEAIVNPDASCVPDGVSVADDIADALTPSLAWTSKHLNIFQVGINSVKPV
jgi:hypothetical protein